ncbi:Acg family FMN-binding oxidoreductase [Streptomyces cupreus]|uniref:Nitroreductase family protein n=1 Tax=Streptomyces cupreus TaxID=2759956 RepID=A0A7X1JA31_9ACTN|nr:nitroreductase family protein [Streptomyces cupreus]MBC2906931.1 nitroreductase family protein [Streptomyces cupreus]
MRAPETSETPALDAPAVEMLLTAATAAPSIHNTQPWRFGVDRARRALHVRVAAERALPRADPKGRARHLSVGAAVFNLRVAARHLGWRPEVRLLPDPGDPDLVAVVRLTGRPDPYGHGPQDLDLYEAIERRHTSRRPFTGRPVPEPVVARMADGAYAEGARLWVPDLRARRRLLRLTAEAEARNNAGRARAAESRAWINAPGSHSPYGIPLTALGPLDATGRMPMRNFIGPLPAARLLPALPFERHVQIALLWTPQDGREDWLRAGQALQCVLLTATAHGVRTSILHQAMEWPTLRDEMRLPQRRCHPQVLIRFGYGPEGRRTPRASAHHVTDPSRDHRP